MRCSSSINARHGQAGLTLIEVLVIAPLIILLIGAMIGYLVSLTGSSLQSGSKNGIINETQSALENIEAEASKALSFPATSITPVSPQGSGDNATAWLAADPNTVLLLTVPAVSKNPLDTSRDLVRYDATPPAPASCATAAQLTDPFPVTIVYYVKSGDLWKRTIVPSDPTCSTTPSYSSVWQRGSCTPGYTSGMTACKAEDEKLVSGLTSFTTTFYTDAAGTTTTADPASAVAVKINLSTSKTAAGQTSSYAGDLQAVSANLAQ